MTCARQVNEWKYLKLCLACGGSSVSVNSFHYYHFFFIGSGMWGRALETPRTHSLSAGGLHQLPSLVLFHPPNFSIICKNQGQESQELLNMDAIFISPSKVMTIIFKEKTKSAQVSASPRDIVKGWVSSTAARESKMTRGWAHPKTPGRVKNNVEGQEGSPV